MVDIWTDAIGRRSDRPRVVYQVASVDSNSKPKDASEDSEVLGMLKRHLLQTPAALPPKATSIPTDRDLLLQRLLGTVHPVQPVVQERSGITDIEVLLQSMLPVTSVADSCGEADHTLCPVLNESFPFLPPGWRADRVDDGFVLRPPPRWANCHQAGNVD